MAEQEEFKVSAESSRWTELKAAVAARLGVAGDFIRVPQLAKALGISSTSIHAQMRRGIFPIFHRRVGNVILVKLDDYVRWFDNNSDGTDPPLIRCTKPSVPERFKDLEESCETPEKLSTPILETKAQFKARLNLEVLAKMRSRGFKV